RDARQAAQGHHENESCYVYPPNEGTLAPDQSATQTNERQPAGKKGKQHQKRIRTKLSDEEDLHASGLLNPVCWTQGLACADGPPPWRTWPFHGESGQVQAC